MNRLYLLFIFLTAIGGASAQKSVGMTVGTHYTWGNGFTWNDAATFYSGNNAADSAKNSPYQSSSTNSKTSFTIGANFRVKPMDSTRFLFNWSRNYSISIGTITLKEMAAGDIYRYDVNTPYTTIYQGDTTVYSLDSTHFYRHGLIDRGAFAQAGFGLLRELPTQTRVKGEIGFQLSVGMGQTKSAYNYYHELSEIDSTANFSPGTYTDERNDVRFGTQTLLTAQFSIIGGIIIPLAKDDNTWWLSLHGALGIGGMYAYEKWAGRMSFVPTMGINYRLMRKTHHDDYH